MSDEPLSAIDGRALIAQIRAGDEIALEAAYKQVFGTDIGRLVLAHHLSEMGVGANFGFDNLKYRAGRHDAALDLASKAGFDATTVSVAVLTDNLEGNTDDDAQGPLAFDDLLD